MINAPERAPAKSNVIPLFDHIRMRERFPVDLPYRERAEVVPIANDPLTMLADAAAAAALELRSRGARPLAELTNQEQDGTAANVVELDPIANRLAKCEAVLCELRASIAAEEAR